MGVAVNVLVVNIGSTSLKFRLIGMADERELARGAIEGIGGQARMTSQIGGQPVVEMVKNVATPMQAVDVCLHALTAPAGSGPRPAIDAVGFKAVHGGSIDQPVRVDDAVLAVMESFADACPAHNPAYVAAMRAFRARRPELPLVAVFETGFHQTIPASRQTYAIPHEWTVTHGVRRYGFHGASHAYVAQRVAQLLRRDDLRIISCHLGGSSSICALHAGKSVANSFGFAPQSGLPHNNRVGDFDAFALPHLAKRTGLTIEQLLAELSRAGGLLGISSVSNDLREVLAAARQGNARAILARDVLVESVRHYLGAALIALGGLDALVFTGGIGQRSSELRRRICSGLEFLGICLDEGRNAAPIKDSEISSPDACVHVWVLETNEELIVARHTVAVLTAAGRNGPTGCTVGSAG